MPAATTLWSIAFLGQHYPTPVSSHQKRTQCPCFYLAVPTGFWSRDVSQEHPIHDVLSSHCIWPRVPPQASPGQCRWDLAGAHPSTSPRTADLLHTLHPGTPKPLPAQVLSKSSRESGVVWGLREHPGGYLFHMLQSFLCSNCLLGYQCPNQLYG